MVFALLPVVASAQTVETMFSPLEKSWTYGASPGTPCPTGNECTNGDVCLNQICTKKCTSNDECLSGEVCDETAKGCRAINPQEAFKLALKNLHLGGNVVYSPETADSGTVIVPAVSASYQDWLVAPSNEFRSVYEFSAHLNTPASIHLDPSVAASHALLEGGDGSIGGQLRGGWFPKSDRGLALSAGGDLSWSAFAASIDASNVSSNVLAHVSAKAIAYGWIGPAYAAVQWSRNWTVSGTGTAVDAEVNGQSGITLMGAVGIENFYLQARYYIPIRNSDLKNVFELRFTGTFTPL